MSANEQVNGKAVALLARMGVARDKLHAGLISAGGHIVLEEEPQAVSCQALLSAAPQVVVVALEPAVEDAVEALDEVLQSPALSVMFEEAELAARRDGWEEQRWIRHLAAKLHGHDQVLPPGAAEEPAPVVSPSAIPQAPHIAPDAVPALESSLADATAELAIWEMDNAFGETVQPLAFETTYTTSAAFDVAPVLDVEAPLSAPQAASFATDEIDASGLSFAPSDQEFSAQAAESFAFNADAVADEASLAAHFQGFSLPYAAPVIEADAAPSWEDILAQESARAPAATAPEPVVAAAPSVPPPLPPLEPTAPAIPAASSWSLVSDEEWAAPAPVSPPPVVAAESLLSSGLSLVELDDAAAAPAAVQGTRRLAVLLAGIGGPDAVRRVLAELPEELPGAVLVQMRLNGGRYDNLVRQMARATQVPVVLAEDGHPIEQGHIYILADGISITPADHGYRFVSQTNDELISKLSPRDSAVLMLSGADVVHVDTALAFGAAGGFVAGQSGNGCYAPEAGNLLADAGMPTATPEQLSQELTSRWGA